VDTGFFMTWNHFEPFARALAPAKRENILTEILAAALRIDTNLIVEVLKVVSPAGDSLAFALDSSDRKAMRVLVATQVLRHYRGKRAWIDLEVRVPGRLLLWVEHKINGTLRKIPNRNGLATNQFSRYHELLNLESGVGGHFPEKLLLLLSRRPIALPQEIENKRQVRCLLWEDFYAVLARYHRVLSEHLGEYDIRRVYVDRGFYSIRVVRLLQGLGLKFLMPARQTAPVKRAVERMVQRKQYRKRYTIRNPSDSTTCNLFVVYDRDEEEWQPFITNLTVTEDNREHLGESYRRRWGIETGFRMKNQYRVKSTSRVYSVRFFLVMMAIALYNFWVLLNAWDAQRQGMETFVYVTETRPRSQGAKLTAWELGQAGIPHTVIADAAAGYFFQRGEIDCVLVGADRIAANGDVANKVGTYPLAVMAKRHGVPLYVAAPRSTFDLSTPDGAAIPIEERSEDEVLCVWGLTKGGAVEQVRVTPEGTSAKNPAFDVTPASLVSQFITEAGLLEPTPERLADFARRPLRVPAE